MKPCAADESGDKSPQSKNVASPWAPYRPSADAPWDLSRVVHLHRRAGFAASWQELQRDLANGPEASIARLLKGRVPRREPREQVERVARLLAEAAVASHQPVRLKAWWIYRMLHSPDPLGEQLVLMWHNHFATSNLKVNDLAAMQEQNELFRRLGRAPFGELLRAALRDPALLVWLDAPSNRRGAPNENLARELMELFTLGIGHYRESDVKEAARSLTGWTVVEGQCRENAEWHDLEEKTVLGRTGPWRADDLIKILLDQDATADRLVWRILSHSMWFKKGSGIVVRSSGLAAWARGCRSYRSRWRKSLARLFPSIFGLAPRPGSLCVGRAELLYQHVTTRGEASLPNRWHGDDKGGGPNIVHRPHCPACGWPRSISGFGRRLVRRPDGTQTVGTCVERIETDHVQAGCGLCCLSAG